VLTDYVEYYLRSRPHAPLLNKDAPVSRAAVPPTNGDIVSIPQVGGLHHRDERRAA
jgi:putative transposase